MFSTVRFVGSLGFAVMAAVAGKILMHDIRYVFVLFCVLRFFSWLVSLRIPTVMGHPKFKGEKDSFFDLFKDKVLTVIYLYLFLISIATGFFNSFHVIYSKHIGVPKRLRTRGQMMNSIVLLGASGIIGGALGGFISTLFGLQLTFVVCSLFCVISVIRFILAIKIVPEFKKNEAELALVNVVKV
jgi:MFS family permease